MRETKRERERAMKAKPFVLIGLVLSGLGILILNHLNLVVHLRTQRSAITTPTAATHRSQSASFVFPAHSWLLTKHVSHYATLMMMDDASNDSDTHILHFTSLAFIRDSMERADYLREHLKCVFRLDFTPSNQSAARAIKAPSEIYEIHYKPMTIGPRSLWRIKCNLTIEDGIAFSPNNSTRVVIALVIEQEADDASLLFKRPRRVNDLSSTRKRPHVAHCLHKVIRLTQSRFKMLSNWIDMQRAIGIHKIKMCMFDSNITQYERQIEEKYQDYVELVKHSTRIEDVCKWQIEKQQEHPELLANCQEMHTMHFNMSKYAVFQHHQMICTQTCYASFRHEYEYVTNSYQVFLFLL